MPININGYGEGGGAFTFLRKINADGFAGSLSWVLIVGYVLTNAVYAFTFGHYLGYVVDLGPWFPRTAGVAIMVLFIGLNLRGVGEAGVARIITGLGALAAAAASVALIVRLVRTGPLAIAFLGLLILIAVFGRPVLLRHIRTESRHN